MLVIYAEHLDSIIELISNIIYLYYHDLNIILMYAIIPIKIYDDLNNYKNFRSDLHRIGGVYGIVNTSDPENIKQYIGSSKDLYHRILDHIKGNDSNSRLQRSIAKYNIENFKIYIYYIHSDPSVKITDIETEVIKSFPFENLYNYKKEASSMLGYKHTLEAIKKMKLRFKDKSNHPMFGKTHDKFALAKISKPGKLNPMFTKTHSPETKLKISLAKSKVSVGLYDTKNKLFRSFSNQVELGKYLNISKSTVGRYLKSKKLVLNKYYISIINDNNNN